MFEYDEQFSEIMAEIILRAYFDKTLREEILTAINTRNANASKSDDLN